MTYRGGERNGQYPLIKTPAETLPQNAQQEESSARGGFVMVNLTTLLRLDLLEVL